MTAIIHHPNRPLRVAIVGVGLAGGAAAIYLGRIPGIDLQLYERSPEHRQVGAWIGVTASGQKILADLCGPEKLPEISYCRNEANVRLKDGTPLPSGGDEGDVGSAQTIRQELHRILVEQIPPHIMHGGKRAMGYTSTQDAIQVNFYDGTFAEADLVVVSDGIKSKVRQQFRPGDEVLFSGTLEYMEIFSMSEMRKIIPECPDTFTFWLDGGEDAGMVFMGSAGGDRFGIICVVQEPPESGIKLAWAEEGGAERIARLQEHFKDWDPLIGKVLSQMKNMTLYPVYRGTFLENLTDGERLCFIGDAAHPTGGAYGAGCSFAFGDAEALYKSLSYVASTTPLTAPGALPKALRIYNETRRHFCKKVFKQLASDIETGEMRQQEWIIAHEVTPEFDIAVAAEEEEASVLGGNDKARRKFQERLVADNLLSAADLSIIITPDAYAVTPLIDLGFGAQIDDVYTSEDKEKPMSAGLFTMTKFDAPFVYTYKYHELKYIISGEMGLEDKATGIKILAKAGDVLRIGKGTTVHFTSPSEGKAFYVGQRALRDF